MATVMLDIQRAPALATATRLLQAAQLPTEDLTDSHLEDFFFATRAGEPIGLVGIEPYGANALLRSLVVVDKYRSQGLGTALLTHAESYARSRGVQSLYLLTTTAERFFLPHGFTRVARESAPEQVKSTREFTSICPSSSAFLTKALGVNGGRSQ